MDRAAIKDEARRLADDLLDELFELACRLHADPELSSEEHRSSALLTDRLAAAGFEVETGIAGLKTAFAARFGAGPQAIGFLAEYDALPEIGHACGHNLIGTAALGAGLVLAHLLPDGCRVEVIGTPAEETLGGKAVMAERGVFDHLDAALMVHPSVEERVLVDSLACQSLEVTYLGRAAHAVARPERGINALDPLLALFSARDALARAAVPGVRLVGIIKEGGVRANIIPDRAVGQFSIRAPGRVVLENLVKEFEHRARTLGNTHRCRAEVRATDSRYDDMLTSVPLADAYRDNLRALGHEVNDAPRVGKGSLDMGNVSYRVPSVHPFFAIAPPATALHTREFAAASVSPAGREGLRRSVAALAMTGLDIFLDEDLRRRAAAAQPRSPAGGT